MKKTKKHKHCWHEFKNEFPQYGTIFRQFCCYENTIEKELKNSPKWEWQKETHSKRYWQALIQKYA